MLGHTTQRENSASQTSKIEGKKDLSSEGTNP